MRQHNTDSQRSLNVNEKAGMNTLDNICPNAIFSYDNILLIKTDFAFDRCIIKLVEYDKAFSFSNYQKPTSENLACT